MAATKTRPPTAEQGQSIFASFTRERLEDLTLVLWDAKVGLNDSALAVVGLHGTIRAAAEGGVSEEDAASAEFTLADKIDELREAIAEGNDAYRAWELRWNAPATAAAGEGGAEV